jgi:hypothetical protein
MIPPNEHVLEYVDDYLHEALEPAEAATLEGHCEACRICKTALEEARKRFAALQAVPTCEPSGGLIQATLARIEAYEQKRRRNRRLLLGAILPAAAAVVALLAGAHLYYLNAKPTSYDLKVLGQADLIAASTGSLRVRLINRGDNWPVPGVPVTIDLQNRGTGEVIRLASFNTDAAGTGQPRFRLPDWADGSYELRVTATSAAGPEILSETVRLKRSWKLMLTSDKPVYQPGQTIRVRALALQRTDLHPVAEQPVTITVADPKGTVIFKKQGATSRYGIAAAECELASEILEGAYAVACRVGDTESKLTVQVEKYVLPKFKFGVELDQPYYQPGQTAVGRVQADYFFGKPVAGGTVDVEITTPGAGPADPMRVQTLLDGEGKGMFKFPLPKTLVGRPQDGGDARVTFTVTVTDTAGQKYSRTLSRVVTAQPLRVEVIPEDGSLVSGVANTVYLFVSYPDGRPAKARLRVSGVDGEVATSELGVASFELTPDGAAVDLTVSAADGEGRTGRREVQLTCGRPGPDFLIRTDRAVYDSGQTMRLVALGGGREPVFVDFLKDGQTILTQVLDITANKGVYELDLPSELFGTVEICAYRLGPDSLPVRKTRTIYIRRAGQLRIKATFDKPEYRPGGRAKLQLALTDDRGNPTPGALSLAAVDEAVFAVLKQAPGLEGRFYLLEQEMLKPVYTLYPWAPDLQTGGSEAERVRFEQTLFARTARTLEGVQVPGAKPRQWGRSVAGAASTAAEFTLAASSFPIKAQEFEQLRHRRLELVHLGWQLLAAVLILVGYILLWILVRPLWVVLALHGFGLALLCGAAGWFLVESVGVGAKFARNAAMTEAAAPPGTAGGAPLPKSLPPSPAPPGAKSASAPAVRVRDEFPETLLWKPEVITDDQGRASLDIELADSITTWRLTAGAVAADGRLGALQVPLRVFQPFFVDLNLPVALTRGDEVAIPVVVYNYLDKPQTVELALNKADWFERLDDGPARLELKPGEVRSTSYRLRVTRVGSQTLQVTARGAGVADALRRVIEVVPDGRRVEQVVSGALQQPRQIALTVPADAIEGSPKAILKIYPSTFSQLVEGLDAIFRMPSGCFEQTSSTTYPNVLALDYLRRTQKQVPEIEARARQYIHLGYQRLLGFETATGGFDWYGRSPGNVALTAYGLMEFQDMARVHDVDPQLIQRTRRWLLQHRRPDGSWPAGGGSIGGLNVGNYGLTAYVAWAVYHGQAPGPESGPTLRYLLDQKPEAIREPYVLALVCNALQALDPEGGSAAAYLQRLEGLKAAADDGKRVWWDLGPGAVTAFYGAGRAGSIETTALAVLALLHAGQSPGTVQAALTWLVEQKDAGGTWHSTQATVLALKALLAGTGKPLGGDRERRIALAWDDGPAQDIVIPADQADVMRQLDLSDRLAPGAHRLTLTDQGGSAAAYQLTFRYHVAGAAEDRPGPLAVDVTYDRTDLAVNDTVTATAAVLNRTNQAAPMVILDLPIPAGFALATGDLDKLVTEGKIDRYQLTPRSVIVYLRTLLPDKSLTLRYGLKATMPVKVAVPAAQAYQYYDPSKRGIGTPRRLTVAPMN